MAISIKLDKETADRIATRLRDASGELRARTLAAMGRVSEVMRRRIGGGMNEREWLACNNMGRMLAFLNDATTAEIRVMVARTLQAGGVPAYYEGPHEPHACDLIREVVGNPWRLGGEMHRRQFECKVCGEIPDKDGERSHGRGCYTQNEDGGGSDYIDEVVFPLDDLIKWGDGKISALARHIRQSAEFDRLPVLADMLEEAGCREAAILDHLRGSEKCAWCNGSAWITLRADGAEVACPRCNGKGTRAPQHTRECWALRLLAPNCEHEWFETTTYGDLAGERREFLCAWCKETRAERVETMNAGGRE